MQSSPEDIARHNVRLLAEIERMSAAISYVRQRSQRACEILNEFDATYKQETPPAT